MSHASTNKIWQDIVAYAQAEVSQASVLAKFFQNAVLQHTDLSESLAWIIAQKLHCKDIAFENLYDNALAVFSQTEISNAIAEDLNAAFTRDGACQHVANAFLFYKGFHALQTHRIAHALWNKNENAFAFLFQSKCSSIFGVDIHPAAVVGKGIMFDHATGIVVGETARIGDNVSIMQSVTLGGTGKEHDDRHPKIASGVLISCGASILGNIHLGEGAKVAAGSVVLKDVAAHTTVAGVPAKPIGEPNADEPALSMNHQIDCDSVNLSLKGNAN